MVTRATKRCRPPPATEHVPPPSPSLARPETLQKKNSGLLPPHEIILKKNSVKLGKDAFIPVRHCKNPMKLGNGATFDDNNKCRRQQFECQSVGNSVNSVTQNQVEMRSLGRHGNNQIKLGNSTTASPAVDRRASRRPFDGRPSVPRSSIEIFQLFSIFIVPFWGGGLFISTSDGLRLASFFATDWLSRCASVA